MEMSLKNLILSGIGAAAYSYEKAEQIVDEMVNRGEITLKQGKQLNEELKRKYKDTREEIRKTAPVTQEALRNILSDFDFATRRDIEELKAKLDEIEKKIGK